MPNYYHTFFKWIKKINSQKEKIALLMLLFPPILMEAQSCYSAPKLSPRASSCKIFKCQISKYKNL